MFLDIGTPAHGVNVQYSTDGIEFRTLGAVGSSASWYNTSTVRSFLLAGKDYEGTTAGWNGTTNGQWVLASVDMPQLAGQRRVYLRFNFASNDDFVNTGDGMAFDEIEIDQVAQPVPLCATTFSPANGTSSFAGQLQWSRNVAETLNVTYRVYLDTVNPPEMFYDVGNATSYYQLPATVPVGTRMFWTVVPQSPFISAVNCPIFTYTVGTPFTVSTFPYVANFSGGQLPFAWSNWNTLSDGENWQIASAAAGSMAEFGAAYDHTTNATSGAGVGYIWVDDSAPHSNRLGLWMLTPLFNLNTLTTPRLSMWVWNQRTSVPPTVLYVDALVHATVGPTSQWQTILTINGQFDSWTEVGVDLTPLRGATPVRFRLRAVEPADGLFMSDFSLDDFRVGEAAQPALCASAVAPSNGALRYTNISLQWARNSSETNGQPRAWLVRWGTAANALTYQRIVSGDVTSLSDVLAVPLVPANETLYWQVQPLASGGLATTTCPVWSFTVGRPSAISAYPYLQTFDSGLGGSSGWFSDPYFGAGGEFYAVSNAEFGAAVDRTSGTGLFVFRDDSAGFPPDTHLLSPMFDLDPLSNPVMSFWLQNARTNVNQVPSRVFVEAVAFDHINATTPWSTVLVIDKIYSQWTRFTVNLATFGGLRVRFRFRVRHAELPNFKSDVCIDDVSVFEGPSSIPPCPLVSIDWFAVTWQAVPDAGYYEVSLGTDGGGILPPTDVVSNEPTYEMQFPTQPLGTYYAQVNSLNAYGASQGCAVVASAQTVPQINTYPYFNTFENGFGGWHNALYDSVKDWQRVTEARYGAQFDHTTGRGSFVFVDDSVPATSQVLLESPQFLNLPEQPVLSFWYQNRKTQNPDASQEVSLLYVDAYLPNARTWLQVWQQPDNSREVFEWTQITVDLSNVPFQFLRFRAIESPNNFVSEISVDDISVRSAATLTLPCPAVRMALQQFGPYVQFSFDQVPSATQYLLYLGTDGQGVATPRNVFNGVPLDQVPGVRSTPTALRNRVDMALPLPPGTYFVMLVAQSGSTSGGAGARQSLGCSIDAVLVATVQSFPFIETFDSDTTGLAGDNSMAHVVNDLGDSGKDFDAVFVSENGASADFTTGDGKFAVRRDTPPHLRPVSLLTPVFDLRGDNITRPTLSFWYQNAGRVTPNEGKLSVLHVDLVPVQWNSTARALLSPPAGVNVTNNSLSVLGAAIDSGLGEYILDVVPPVRDLRRTWTEVVIDLSAYASLGSFAVRFRVDGGGTLETDDQFSDLSLDDVVLLDAERAPPCPQISRVSVAGQSVAFVVAPVMPDTIYTYFVGSDGNGIATPTNVVNDQVLPLEAMYAAARVATAGTYYIQVRASNAFGNAPACPIVGINVTTRTLSDSPQNWMLASQFDSTGSLGWLQNQLDDGGHDWDVDSVSPNGAQNGLPVYGKFAYVFDDDPHRSPTNLVSQPLDISNVTQPTLSFWYQNQAVVSALVSQLTVELVQISTNGANSEPDYTEAMAVPFSMSVTAWSKVVVDLSSYKMLSPFSLRFRSVSQLSGSFSDVSIDSVNVFAATATGATLRCPTIVLDGTLLVWSDQPAAGSYTLWLSEPNGDADTADSVLVASTQLTYDLENPVPGARYLARLEVLSGVSGLSDLTNCTFQPFTVPLTSAYPVVWTFPNASTFDGWTNQVADSGRQWLLSNTSEHGAAAPFDAGTHMLVLRDLRPALGESSIVSPFFSLDNIVSPVLMFYYQNRRVQTGDDVSTLSIDVFNGERWINNIIAPRDGQATEWTPVTINLATTRSVSRFRFRAVPTGLGQSDITIDAISIGDLNSTSMCASVSLVQQASLLSVNWTPVFTALDYVVFFGTDGAGRAVPSNIFNGTVFTGTSFTRTVNTGPYYITIYTRSFRGLFTQCRISSVLVRSADPASVQQMSFENGTFTTWQPDPSTASAWSIVSSTANGAASAFDGQLFAAMSDVTINSTFLVSPNFQFNLVRNPSLSFVYINQRRANVLPTVLHLDVSRDDGVWRNDVIAPLTQSVTNWTRVTVDLTPFRSTATRIRIRLSAFPLPNNSEFSLDDLRISFSPTEARQTTAPSAAESTSGYSVGLVAGLTVVSVCFVCCVVGAIAFFVWRLRELGKNEIELEGGPAPLLHNDYNYEESALVDSDDEEADKPVFRTLEESDEEGSRDSDDGKL